MKTFIVVIVVIATALSLKGVPRAAGSTESFLDSSDRSESSSSSQSSRPQGTRTLREHVHHVTEEQ